MRTFIQLRDNIGFATVVTNGEVDHSVTPDHTTAIEVFTENPEQFLKKVYHPDTKSWTDAPLIRFAEFNEFGEIIEIRRTPFAHEIPSNAAIMPAEATAQWTYINGEWSAPIIVLEPEPQGMIESPTIIAEAKEDGANEIITDSEAEEG